MSHKYYNAINVFYKSQYFTIKNIWDRYGSWEKAWDNIKNKNHIDPNREWDKLEKNNIRLILSSNKEFPRLLREIPHSPFGLYVKGSYDFSLASIAIVGTRKSTQEGQKLSEDFSQKLSEQNIAIISGLALGIDQAAHRGAISCSGKTVAVMANGLDTVYPRQHFNLSKKIIDCGGAIVSEYALGTPPYPSNFLERNRIISGLSSGIIVIEAPFGSGALATAQYAIEQNREVFVVPGSLNQPNYTGSLNLIKNGASLITSINDIFESLNMPLLENQKLHHKELPLTKEQKVVLNYVENDGGSLSIDKIIKISKLEPHIANQAISFLVINGIIKEDRGKYYL